MQRDGVVGTGDPATPDARTTTTRRPVADELAAEVGTRLRLPQFTALRGVEQVGLLGELG